MSPLAYSIFTDVLSCTATYRRGHIQSSLTRTLQSNELIRENGRVHVIAFGLSMSFTKHGESSFATSFHAWGSIFWTAPPCCSASMYPRTTWEKNRHAWRRRQSDAYSFWGVMSQVRGTHSPTSYALWTDVERQGDVPLLHTGRARDLNGDDAERSESMLVTE
ncbi:hypothetical protein EV363DRAFT_1338731, partial [Boletus edulis]